MDLRKDFSNTITSLKEARSLSPDTTSDHRALSGTTDDRPVTRGEYDHDMDQILKAFDKMYAWQNQMVGIIGIIKWLVPVVLTAFGAYVELRHHG